MSINGKTRDEIAHEADLVRARLLRTVEQLDQKRHNAVDIRRQLREHTAQLAVFAGLLLAAAAGTVAIAVHRMATSAERRRRQRWLLAKRMWRHPDRELRAERGSFGAEVLRSILLTVTTTLVALPARLWSAKLERVFGVRMLEGMKRADASPQGVSSK
jgi:hypothetical protein